MLKALHPQKPLAPSTTEPHTPYIIGSGEAALQIMHSSSPEDVKMHGISRARGESPITPSKIKDRVATTTRATNPR